MRDFDYALLKKKTWGRDVIELVSEINGYRASLRKSPAALSALEKAAFAENVSASNEIEGICVPAARAALLCDGGAEPENMNERLVAGYADALRAVNGGFMDLPLSVKTILGLHKTLFSRTPYPGGEYKMGQNYIARTEADGTREIVFLPPDPYETPVALRDACRSFAKEEGDKDMEPLLLTFSFVFDFLCIHPFADGNGRVSRLLTALLLQRAGYGVERYVATDRAICDDREAYYTALDKSNPGWDVGKNDSSPFVRYMLEKTASAYRVLSAREI